MAEPPKRKVIKKGDGHGHHGGAWKVAYADFVTAMMALFMVLWLLASSDAQTRKEIANYFRTGIMPEGSLSMNRAAQIAPPVIEAAPSPPPPGQGSISEDTATQLRNEMVRLGAIDATLAKVIEGVHVEVTPDGVLIEIVDEGNNLLFDLSSAKLKQPLVDFLQKLGPVLADTDARIEVNGHTDA
ncbi:MAG: flagellar motor protein MotB, partial [Kofleriaceae bacterium]